MHAFLLVGSSGLETFRADNIVRVEVREVHTIRRITLYVLHQVFVIVILGFVFVFA